MRLSIAVGLLALLSAISPAAAAPLGIVAAENFYGDIARQIGGGDVMVTSILSNPDQDPHEFEASPSTARAFATARIVIYNGAGYDPWAARLSSVPAAVPRDIVVVARLVHKTAADNPHLWYDPGTMPRLARHLALLLERLDPAHRSDYARNLASFQQSLAPLDDEIATLRGKYSGTRVTATEPVFGYMAAALGLDMRNPDFQLAIMNDTEPSAAAIAGIETDLKTRAVKLLIYNNQTSIALTRRVRMIAVAAGVPVVGVSETEPLGKDYQEWMRSQLDAVGRALAR
ncbi:MAG TPA: zinc ABC transporter substrate-binding protein [Stellaceae bacterium]|nr:zinc ABC transporter substrate-binding protein [Stellaceae bacterium]